MFSMVEEKRIIFKIGGDMKKDIHKMFENPSSLKGGGHVIYFKDWNSMLDALTPQRLHLLQRLIEYDDEKPMDVSKLACATKRKQESISRDLIALEKSGLISKIKKGKSVYPHFNAKEIVIQLG